MAINASFTSTLAYNNTVFGGVATIASDLAIPFSVTLEAAKTGSLTTRTNNTTGTLTMAASHGITTGARLDLYWSGGSRRGITVGTVSVNSVPFSGGAGDNLPVQDTAITAQVPVSENLVVTGNDVVSIGTRVTGGGTIVFTDGSNAEIFATTLTSDVPSYAWASGYGGTNPLAGGSVAKVFLSQRSSAGTSTGAGLVQYN
jgi:hypothetical protein